MSIIDLLDQLNTLDPSKEQWPDGIPPWFLNTHAAQLATIIHTILKVSVYSSQFPEAWTHVNVNANVTKMAAG